MSKLLFSTLFSVTGCILSGQAFYNLHKISMASRNTNNVYKGENSLRDYFDPDQQPMIPMVELPRKLNPFYEDGVRIYAKMMGTLPANNVKSLPGMFHWAALFPTRSQRS